MYDVQLSTTAYPLVFYMVDSVDHIAAKTGLSPTVTIRKVGGSFASPSGSVTEIANGWYQVAGNATDTNTLGPLLLHATSAGADPCDVCYRVVSFNPQDAVRLGLTALPNANAEASGGLYTRGSGAGQINQANNGQVDVNTIRLNGTSNTARDIGASVLLSAGTGTGQLDFTSGVVKANLAQILGTALTETAGQIAAAFKKVFDIASPVFTAQSVNQTGDSYARLGAPAGASIAADLAEIEAETDAIGTDTSGVTTLLSRIPGTVQPQTGDAYARLGAPAGASVSADVAAVKSDTAAINSAVDTEVAAIKAKTDNLPASPAAVGSAMTLDMTQAVPSSNTAQTVGDALNAARAQGFGRWVLSGTTLTLYAGNGSTVVRTFTLDSGSAPTSRT